MSLNECYNCKYANEYLLTYWYPRFNPTCSLGHQMDTDNECRDFQLIGRGSR